MKFLTGRQGLGVLGVDRRSVDKNEWQPKREKASPHQCQSVEEPEMTGSNADTAAGPLGAGTVTIVEGSSYCISLPNGDIRPECPHGVFSRTRASCRAGS